MSQTEWLKPQTLSSPVLESEKFKIKVQQSGESSFPGVSHMAERQRRHIFFLSFLIRALIPSWEFYLYNLNTITLGIRISTYAFGEAHQHVIHSNPQIENIYCKPCVIKFIFYVKTQKKLKCKILFCPLASPLPHCALCIHIIHGSLARIPDQW